MDRENSELITKTVSYKAKTKKDFERQKALMKIYYSYLYHELYDKQRQERINTNYKLLNGIVDDDVYNAPLEITMEGQEVTLGYPNITHHPLISKVAAAAIGEEIRFPFKISVTDKSRTANNNRKRQKKAMLKEYITEVHIKPLEQKLMQDAAPMLNTTPLSDEEYQNLIAQIQQQVKVMTPKEINEYIENDFKSPEEIQGQLLMNILTERLRLKRKKNDGFEDVYAVAESYYHPAINHNDFQFETLNPRDVAYLPTPGKPFVQDAVAVLHRKEVSLQEAFSLDGEYFSEEDAKKLIDLVHGFGYTSHTYGELSPADEEVIYQTHMNPEIASQFGDINLSTYEGQTKAILLYDHILGENRNGGYYLTRSYIAWRDMAFFKRVKRRLADGTVDYFWESEDYVLNPAMGDISLKKIQKPEVWHGVMYGDGDNAIFVKIEAIPNQRRSLENIHDVPLPIFGGKINTRKGNAPNISNVDMGKIWNQEFDMLMAEYKMKQASNIGEVFILLKELKPINTGWNEWIATMRYLKLLILEGKREDLDLNPNLINLMKGVSLSTINDIMAIINLLGFVQKNLAESMLFSPERLGNIGQYMNTSVAETAVGASEIQTTRLYDIHNYIFLEATQYLFDIARTAMKKNKYLRELILDDISQAEIEIDFEMLARAELNVFNSLSAEDLLKVREIKQNTLEIIQNQMMDIEDLFKYHFADTPSELMNIGTAISKKRKDAEAAAQQSQQEQVKMAIQQELEKFQREADLQIRLQQMKDASDEKSAVIDSMKFAKTMDINQDGINDNYQIAMEKLKSEREQFDKEMQANKEQFAKEMELKQKEIEVKMKQITQKPKNNSK